MFVSGNVGPGGAGTRSHTNLRIQVIQLLLDLCDPLELNLQFLHHRFKLLTKSRDVLDLVVRAAFAAVAFWACWTTRTNRALWSCGSWWTGRSAFATQTFRPARSRINCASRALAAVFSHW